MASKSADGPRKSTGRIDRRQLRGEASRRQIVEAAGALFARHGYAGTSIAQVSKACGLPASSLYWHFGSKEGLLWAVAESMAVDFLEQGPRTADFDGDPIDRLERMLSAIVDQLREGDHGEGERVLRLTLLLTMADEGEAEGSRKAADHVRDVSIARMREAMRAIFAADGDPDRTELADGLAALARAFGVGAFVEAQRGGKTDHDYYRRLLTDFVDLVRARAAEHDAPPARASTRS